MTSWQKKPSWTSVSDPLPEPETEPDDRHQEAPSTSAMEDHGNEEEETEKEEEDPEEEDPEEEPMEKVEEEEPMEKLEEEPMEKVEEEDPEVEVEEEDPEEEPMEEEEDEVEEEEVPETIKEKRKQKELEVFVGGLPRDADENDLARVFNRIGEVVEVRLPKTHPLAPTNKGFAFVRFATLDQARKVIVEHGHVIVKGKSCGVIRNNDNETLHLANICTNWTKDDLIEKLKGFQLKNLEEVHLVDDSYNIGKNKGFAFLEFSTHTDAVDACCKFQGRALFFGTDVKAEVSFSKIHEPDEEVMAQEKSLFLDGLPVSWDGAQLREQFKKFGEIESVQLARYMPTARRKDFGFICFTTREAAEYCFEHVNKAGVGEGDSKVFVKATWKRPYLQKRTPQELGVRQGYIGKGFCMKPQNSYGSAHSYLGRPARLQEWMCRESNNRSRDFDRFSSRVPTFKTGVPSPAGKYRAQSRSKSANEMPGTTLHTRRSRDPYYSRDPYHQSSSADRRTPGSFSYYCNASSLPEGQYSDADVYDLQYEDQEAYECYSVPGFNHSYPEPEPDNPAPRRSRSKPGLEIGAYPKHGGVAYNEYPSVLPLETLPRDRVQYAEKAEYMGRGRGSRYVHRSRPSKWY